MFGIIKPRIDAHTLGISTIINALAVCDYQSCLIESTEPTEIMDWIENNKVTAVGFSYRLDSTDALSLFDRIFDTVKSNVQKVYFAGLPESCRLVSDKYGSGVIIFSGGEEVSDTLLKLGVPEKAIPKSLFAVEPYDAERYKFASELIASKTFEDIKPNKNSGDTYLVRLTDCKTNHTLPIIRAHCGPYDSNREKAVSLFYKWVTELTQSGYLDVLSIGTSQLTQECFEQDWSGKANGGGVPVKFRGEYEHIRRLAVPMLVRTYAGVADVARLAKMHEESLNISWHALSFWWFCETDGRGKNTLLQNLTEHFDALTYIATTKKPLEPNVLHHFAFRGADDTSCIVASFLAIKAAKIYGVQHVIIQYMLNTPRQTSGLQDIAKARILLRLVRELEDKSFSISLQTRAGLDYLSKDIEEAKIQLAAVTMLMDDIEPNNENSPEIVHVVSYSEANNLATPEVIDASIKITLCALREYRLSKRNGLRLTDKYDEDIKWREQALFEESKRAIAFLEANIPDLYSPKGFFIVFERGFFQLPYLFDENNKYPAVKTHKTQMFNGGVFCVDEHNEIVDTIERYKTLLS